MQFIWDNPGEGGVLYWKIFDKASTFKSKSHHISIFKESYLLVALGVVMSIVELFEYRFQASKLKNLQITKRRIILTILFNFIAMNSALFSLSYYPWNQEHAKEEIAKVVL